MAPLAHVATMMDFLTGPPGPDAQFLVWVVAGSVDAVLLPWLMAVDASICGLKESVSP